MRRILVAVVMLFVAQSTFAGEFEQIAAAIASRPGVSRVWIPFFGLARAAVRVARPKGVHDIQLATFEGNGLHDWSSIERAALSGGARFTPVIRSKEKGGDNTLILMRPLTRDRVEMIVLAKDGEDTVLVRLDVDADVAAREIDHGDVTLSLR